jgi:hypothetical protein
MLFLRRGERFIHTGAVSGADAITDGRSFVAFDADEDGDLDIVVKNFQRRTLHYLRNDIETGARSVVLRLEGPSDGERDAIGARVELRAAGRWQLRQVRSAAGFLSQSPRELFFGVGSATKVDEIRILWPGGRAQVVRDLRSGGRYRIVEGAEPRLERSFGGNDHALAPDPFPPVNEAPLRATAPRPAPPLAGAPLNAAARERAREPGYTRPTLVCFITTWCRSCGEDLALLRALWTRPGRGFDIVVVQVVDPQIPEPATSDLAALPFAVFRGDRVDLARFRNSLDFVVPTSFWVDQRGTVRRTYVGKLREERILEDLRGLGDR